jgi:hypothetical protein
MVASNQAHAGRANPAQPVNQVPKMRYPLFVASLLLAGLLGSLTAAQAQVAYPAPPPPGYAYPPAPPPGYYPPPGYAYAPPPPVYAYPPPVVYAAPPPVVVAPVGGVFLDFHGGHRRW